MFKTCFFIFVFCVSSDCYSQQTPADKKILDSLIKNDDFLRMIDSLNTATSYVRLNLSIGNKLFSVNNNSLNAMEQNRKIIFTPSVDYFNKSGFGISFAAFLLNQNNKTGFFQYSLTPSYDYTAGNLIDAGISYTRFFVKDKYHNSINASPIQNDLYVYARLKKTWLKPGISLGYSTGEINDISFVDTTVMIQNRLVRIEYTDTATTKIKSLSISGSVSHVFSVYDILNRNDAFYFIPQFSLNMGSNKYSVSHRTSITKYKVFKKKKKTSIRNFEEESEAPQFKVESIGLTLDLNYNIGRFNFEPQLYFDYYLPSTTETRFTQIFSINVGYMF